MQKTKTGTRELSDKSFNMTLGCMNNCRYCWARFNAVHRFDRATIASWPQEKIDVKKVKANYRKRQGVIMFPTTHDITPLNFPAYVCTLRKLLDAGNEVLITTKPRLKIIKQLCDTLGVWRDQIQFLFTIGSTDDRKLEFWEPGATRFMERLGCLQYAFGTGYSTGVLCEPYIDPFVRHLYELCKPYLRSSFWVGAMRNIKSRVSLDGLSETQIDTFIKPILRETSKKSIETIYNSLSDKPYIKWKDSIRKILEL